MPPPPRPSPAGRIQGQEHDIPGLVRRGEAHEVEQHRLAGVALIRRAGLAADAGALHLPVAARAGRDHILQALAAPGRRSPR